MDFSGRRYYSEEEEEEIMRRKHSHYPHRHLFCDTCNYDGDDYDYYDRFYIEYTIEEEELLLWEEIVYDIRLLYPED